MTPKAENLAIFMLKEGHDFKITINGDKVQGIKINNYYSSDNNKIETLQFSDDTSISINSADQLIQAMSSFGVNNASSMDTNTDHTSSISDMYSLAVSSSINQKAI